MSTYKIPTKRSKSAMQTDRKTEHTEIQNKIVLLLVMLPTPNRRAKAIVLVKMLPIEIGLCLLNRTFLIWFLFFRFPSLHCHFIDIKTTDLLSPDSSQIQKKKKNGGDSSQNKTHLRIVHLLFKRMKCFVFFFKSAFNFFLHNSLS